MYVCYVYAAYVYCMYVCMPMCDVSLFVHVCVLFVYTLHVCTYQTVYVYVYVHKRVCTHIRHVPDSCLQAVPTNQLRESFMKPSLLPCVYLPRCVFYAYVHIYTCVCIHTLHVA